MPLELLPDGTVARQDSRFVALTVEPWLEIRHPVLAKAAGRFVEIVYSAGFWDEPIRPIIRFETADGRRIERIAAGPVAGLGRWIGRVPSGTVRVTVSPTNKVGRFDFAIVSIRRRGLPGLLSHGFRHAPRSTRSAILTRLIGWAPESDINLAWATGSTRAGDYTNWLAARRRDLDLAGLDAPRFDWAGAEPIHIVIAQRVGDDLRATIASLLAQVFPRWRLTVVGEHPPGLLSDPRIGVVRSFDELSLEAGFLGALAAGDRLPPHTLAGLAETAYRDPALALVYGDEEIDGRDGDLSPAFKPGWSRLLQMQAPYLGRAVFVRAAEAGWTHEDVRRFATDASLPDAWLARVADAEVMPLRRVMLRRHAMPPKPRKFLLPPTRLDVSAAIVIPTKDQAFRVRRLLASLDRHTDATSTRIVLIDNGSVEAETAALFAELRSASTVEVIERPGAFNFSAMCNDGAAATDADVLVFLNNDTEILSPDWLERLKAWSLAPGIGAVGAKLTYPDGRLQHIGVLLGMGESAGHFGAYGPADVPGWHGRNTVVHEVSAVTGACLAVSRAKFEAVGGFDATHLPIELSDIDLCLKLAARGWGTIVDPAVHLMHDESASRGRATFRRLDVYESQRAVFKERWRDQLRDDRYFHPGLSLYQWRDALG